jgi:hypothetical protein
MKKLPVLTATLYLILLGACHHQDVAMVEPHAGFDFEPATFTGLNRSIFATFSVIEIIDKSTNGDVYLWDFGNGETSTEKTPHFYYSTSGTYTVTQTITSSTGHKSVTTKQIKITDRILKNIEILDLEWNCLGDFPDWSDDKTADVYVEMRRKGDLFYYKSSVVTGISEHNAPFIISVDEKVIINPMDLVSGLLIFRLIAIDDGKEHIIFRTDASGVGYGSIGYDDSYRVNTGLNGTRVYLNSIFQ